MPHAPPAASGRTPGAPLCALGAAPRSTTPSESAFVAALSVAPTPASVAPSLFTSRSTSTIYRRPLSRRSMRMPSLRSSAMLGFPHGQRCVDVPVSFRVFGGLDRLPSARLGDRHRALHRSRGRPSAPGSRPMSAPVSAPARVPVPSWLAVAHRGLSFSHQRTISVPMMRRPPKASRQSTLAPSADARAAVWSLPTSVPSGAKPLGGGDRKSSTVGQLHGVILRGSSPSPLSQCRAAARSSFREPGGEGHVGVHHPAADVRDAEQRGAVLRRALRAGKRSGGLSTRPRRLNAAAWSLEIRAAKHG